MRFPKGFRWGVASASYQIEGAPAEDGKGMSIWDVFSHTPGKMAGGHNGDVACDAYHRFEHDLDLMKELGIPEYRFSVSWPRIRPDGKGAVNESGLAYYDRVVEGCLARGIKPCLTLYHWDLPQALEDAGGWRNRDTALLFGEFAGSVAGHFADRVKSFITINEPQIFIGLGYGAGLHAPGLKLDEEGVFRCWHHALLANGLATKAVRAAAPEAEVGLSSTGALAYIAGHLPETPSELHEHTFRTATGPDGTPENSFFNHQWFLDPVCLGSYPDDPDSPWFGYSLAASETDLKTIAQKPDFIGLNLYNGTELDPADGYRPAAKYPGYPRTSLRWPVTPEVMYWGCRQIYERYGLPIFVTENGQGCNDRIYLDGCVHDADRIDFLTRYLTQLSDVIEDGVPVLGYYHWSFTDNLEWHSGYDDRFGLVYVDYRTQERIPKDSARWYADLIGRR